MSEEIKKAKPGRPIDLVTSKFIPNDILYHSGNFVIAEGVDDNGISTIACRWHDISAMGYPNGRGQPQWMLLPVRPRDVKGSNNPVLPQSLTMTFHGSKDAIPVGSWVYSGMDWHLVNYIYGDGTHMVSCTGLGKRDSYPIPIDTIESVLEGQTVMDQWFTLNTSNDPSLWISPNGTLVLVIRETDNVYWKIPIYPTFYNDNGAVWGSQEPACFNYQLDGYQLIQVLPNKPISLQGCVEVAQAWKELDRKIKSHNFPIKSIEFKDEINHPPQDHDVYIEGVRYYDLTYPGWW